MFAVRVDSSALGVALTDLERRQLPFAVSLALNWTANLAQEAVRKHWSSALHLQRRDYILRAVKINKQDRASKSTWTVVLSIDPRTQFLARMEEGDLHTPRSGKYLFKPTESVFKSKVISRSNPLNPKNLHFDANGRGPLRTYLVRPAGKSPLILQRTGKYAEQSERGKDNATGRYVAGQKKRKKRAKSGKAGSRLLYQLVSRSKVPVKLQFSATIRSTAENVWQEQASKAMTQALATAK